MTSRGIGGAGTGEAGVEFEEGIRAWEKGDWLTARRRLRAAIESHPGKDDRLEAGRILHALRIDRFALGIASLFLLALVALFSWIMA